MQVSGVAITFGIMEGIAVMLTFLRLGFRLKIQRFWWEDVWAAVASLFTVIFIASTPVFFQTYDSDMALANGWINVYMATSALWSVRMSLLCSVVRITSSIHWRLVTLVVSVSFLLFCAATFGLEAWWCVDIQRVSFSRPHANCTLPHFIIIFEATAHCLADLITLLLTVKLLWRVQLPRRQRRMIIVLFIASRFLCVFSLAHSIAQLVAGDRLQGILFNLQVLAFMLVCNMLVGVTYLYRIFRSDDDGESDDDDDDDDDFTTPPPHPRGSQEMSTAVDLSTVEEELTTVDLDMTCTSFPGTTSDVENSFYCPSTSPSRSRV